MHHWLHFNTEKRWPVLYLDIFRQANENNNEKHIGQFTMFVSGLKICNQGTYFELICLFLVHNSLWEYKDSDIALAWQNI